MSTIIIHQPYRELTMQNRRRLTGGPTNRRTSQSGSGTTSWKRSNRSIDPEPNKSDRKPFSLYELSGSCWTKFAEQMTDLNVSDSDDDTPLIISRQSAAKQKEPSRVADVKSYVMRLDNSDQSLYGQCPETDGFTAVICSVCSAIVKPQALAKHVLRRHQNESRIKERPIVRLAAPSTSQSPIESPIQSSPSSRSSSRSMSPATPSSGRHSDQKRSSAARRCLPISERVYDPDKHCGCREGDDLGGDLVGRPCTRSLTCKIHSIAMRRMVTGRSKRFDELLIDQRVGKELDKTEGHVKHSAKVIAELCDSNSSSSLSLESDRRISTVIPVQNVPIESVPTPTIEVPAEIDETPNVTDELNVLEPEIDLPATPTIWEPEPEQPVSVKRAHDADDYDNSTKRLKCDSSPPTKSPDFLTDPPTEPDLSDNFDLSRIEHTDDVTDDAALMATLSPYGLTVHDVERIFLMDPEGAAAAAAAAATVTMTDGTQEYLPDEGTIVYPPDMYPTEPVGPTSEQYFTDEKLMSCDTFFRGQGTEESIHYCDVVDIDRLVELDHSTVNQFTETDQSVRIDRISLLDQLNNNVNRALDAVPIHLDRIDTLEAIRQIGKENERRMARLIDQSFDSFRGIKHWYASVPKPMSVQRYGLARTNGGAMLRRDILTARKATNSTHQAYQIAFNNHSLKYGGPEGGPITGRLVDQNGTNGLPAAVVGVGGQRNNGAFVRVGHGTSGRGRRTGRSQRRTICHPDVLDDFEAFRLSGQQTLNGHRIDDLLLRTDRLDAERRKFGSNDRQPKQPYQPTKARSNRQTNGLIGTQRSYESDNGFGGHRSGEMNGIGMEHMNGMQTLGRNDRKL